MEKISKSLEELERDIWSAESSFQTSLTKSIFLSRKKPLGDLDSHELRLLISQSVGLKYLIPLALNKLKLNILEESSYYPGDLLLALLNSDNEYWIKNGTERNSFVTLLKNTTSEIELTDIINDEIKKEIQDSTDQFLSRNNN